MEPTKTSGNLSQNLVDSDLDGMTFKKSWNPLLSISGPGARKANKGDSQGAERPVGLTAAQQWQREPADKQQHTQTIIAPGPLY